MLDWLSNDQRASYAESSQFLDAPQTPAPLFAYRALKSVLFGTHDDDDDDENEKENIPLKTRSSGASKKSQNPPMRPISSTPQRPTPRRMLSPAKSILRTPGIPTPHRQNTSVKFKDIKQPLMNLSTITEGSVTGNTVKSPKSKDAAIAPSEAQITLERTTEVEAKLPNPDPESQPGTYYNAKEIDAYIAATEHDMKKLVRYGQRMREYARLSQKENATLKKELNNIRKENQTLRHRDESTITEEKARQTDRNGGLLDLSTSSKHAERATAKGGTEAEPKETEEAYGSQPQHQSRVEFAGKTPKKQSSPKMVKSKIEVVSAPLQSHREAPLHRISATSERPTDNARSTCRTQLPPDRLAAAKARLRVKSEERRKMFSVAEEGRKEDHGSSVVDWQDL